MTDPALMRGPDWVRCCLCGEVHVAPFDGLARASDGQLWDMCATCADDETL